MKDRIRISVTLKPELVSLLDSKIDGTKIRNRSHAVEHFLKKQLLNTTGTAIIYINDEKESLTNIKGVPAIDYILQRLKKAGLLRVIFCHRAECKKLKKLVSLKKYSVFNITFVQHKKDGTADALAACKDLIGNENFFFIHGDILCDIDFYDLEDLHKSHNGLVTMVITSIADPLPWGVVSVKRNLITSFTEKPLEHKSRARLTNLINAGIYVLRPEIFSYINRKTVNLESDIFPQLAKDKQIYSYLLDGLWINVNRKDQLSLFK